MGIEDGKIVLMLDDGQEIKRKCNPVIQDEILGQLLRKICVTLINEVIDTFTVNFEEDDKGKNKFSRLLNTNVIKNVNVINII